MAVSERVAFRYAKALIDLAQEKNLLEVIKGDLSLFSTVTKENRDFTLMLNSPLISGEKKLSILNSIFSGKVNELTTNFFGLITEKGREADLSGIVSSYMAQYNAIEGITKASIKTAISLDASSRKTIEDLVAKATGNSKVIIEEQLDTDLIGGYVLSVEDKQLDASVKTMLQKAKNQFTK